MAAANFSEAFSPSSAMSSTTGLGLKVLASTALTLPALANEFSAVIPVLSLDGTTGFRLDGDWAGDHRGLSVAGAGDVNGDGFAGLIIELG